MFIYRLSNLTLNEFSFSHGHIYVHHASLPWMHRESIQFDEDGKFSNDLAICSVLEFVLAV